MKCMSYDTDEKATSLISRPSNKHKLMLLPSVLLFELERGKRGELKFYVWFDDGL